MKYFMKWENKYLSTDAESMDALIACYKAGLKELKVLRKLVNKKKMTVDFELSNNDLIIFETTSANLADHYGMKKEKKANGK